MADRPELGALGDEELVVGTLEGDTAFFGILVERYWNMVVALALSKIEDPTAAEDIAQESFIRAYVHLHTLRDRARFAGWLTRIVAQESINWIRKHTRERLVSISDIPERGQLEAVSPGANPGLTEPQRELVRQAVRQLPEKFQKVVIMRFVAGLSTSEIARQLGKRSGTVRVWLHRAYQRLRKATGPVIRKVNGHEL